MQTKEFGLRTKGSQCKLSIISWEKRKLVHQHIWNSHLKFSVSVGRQAICFMTIFNQLPVQSDLLVPDIRFSSLLGAWRAKGSDGDVSWQCPTLLSHLPEEREEAKKGGHVKGVWYKPPLLLCCTQSSCENLFYFCLSLCGTATVSYREQEQAVMLKKNEIFMTGTIM